MTDFNPDTNIDTDFESFFRPVDNDRLTSLFRATYPFLIVWQSLGDINIPVPDIFFSYVIRKFTPEITTVFLPSDPAFGQRIRVKDGTGNAATFNITVSGNGNTIDGAATDVFNTNYQFGEFTFNGLEWNETGSNGSGSPTPPSGDFLTDDAGNVLTDDAGNPLLPS